MSVYNENDIDNIISEMKSRTKGKYITQGVAFNKNCPRQMEMLKNALLSSSSFSGLIKELLALKFNNYNVNNIQPTVIKTIQNIQNIQNVKDNEPSVDNFNSWLD